MFVISRLSRVPPGTLSIYANRIYHRRRQDIGSMRRHFHKSSENPFIYFNNSSEPKNSNSSSNENSSSSGISNKVSDGTIPPLDLRWFYATDVPNSQPEQYNYKKTKEPTKFLPFSEQDSDRLETHFNKLLDNKDEPIAGFANHEVPVNEDRLFECDLNEFELKPIYWDGAHYEIRRGMWFDSDNIPCKQELANELETAYMKVAPYNKDFEKVEDASVFTYHLTTADKIAVFTKENSVYLIDSNSSFTDFQIRYLTKLVIPPLLPVEKLSRGYRPDAAKEQENREKSSHNKSDLKQPKEENEMVNDYSNKSDKYSNDREIDHLVICVHGVGQILGTKFENINFIHTINVLRQTMKSVFKENDLLQKMAYHDGDEKTDSGNCRIQVLPLTWRHKVDFNNIKNEQEGSEQLSLSDITIDGIRQLRGLLGDIVLDVLLYYEPHYLNTILEEVTLQANEVYDKYKQKNPDFNGKVSILGHSLGSAICFDILCKQPDILPPEKEIDPAKMLKFPVENYFAIGSPIGVFALLKKIKLISRGALNSAGSTLEIDKDDPSVKSPKCKNFYNIFHPCDPVAYRVEPLVAKEFSHYQPAVIPFAYKNIDAQLQNLTQLGDDLTNKVMGNLNSALEAITTTSPAPADKKIQDTNRSVSNVSHAALNTITKFNYSGRIDYALPAGLFDISIVSAINSHTTYFEQPNVSGFLMRELLLMKEVVKDKKVLLMENEDEDEEFSTLEEDK